MKKSLSHSLLTGSIFGMSGYSLSGFAEEQFKEVEIRVIKNKSFSKRDRIETSATLGAIMNRSFIYTYLANVGLQYHISESFGLFGEGAVAFTFNKSDCTVLGTDFQIEPIVTQVNYLAGGGMTFTPIYGKYQTSTGEVMYYDWFFALSGGIAGVKLRQSSCITNKDAALTIPEKQGSPTQVSILTGQKFFLDNNLAFLWNMRWMILKPPVENASYESMVVLSLGVNYFL